MSAFKSGFVAVVGRPNVGKSTLLNAIMGEKLLIVSDKPQTTRNTIRCILTTDTAQVVFIDTPGIHAGKNLLAQGMVSASRRTWQEVDAILLLVDVSVPMGPGDRFLASQLENISVPVFLVFNKIDLTGGANLSRLETEWQTLLPNPERVFHVSALDGYNVAYLKEELLAVLPEGPKYYPDDMVIDQPERFLVAEFIREKALELTHEEVPHAVAVVVDEMKERETGLLYVSATIYVERESQKGIIIGKKGQMLKDIGARARADLEVLFGAEIYLDLWVKAYRDWRNRPTGLRQMGYEELTGRER